MASLHLRGVASMVSPIIKTNENSILVAIDMQCDESSPYKKVIYFDRYVG